MIHTYINYPDKTIRKCTRCGCIKKVFSIPRENKFSSPKSRYEYHLNGQVFSASPECKIIEY